MVFVLNKRKEPVMPCSEKKAKKLLDKGKAVVHRIHPFVIRLKENKGYKKKGLRLKLDPGSKVTGFAVLMEKNKDESDIILLGEIVHRTYIPKTVEMNGKKKTFYGGSAALHTRSMWRRSRRNRKTRYRPARWQNRASVKRKGKLPPSLEARMMQTVNATKKLMKWLPIEAISVENVKFDIQKLKNPEISGIEYQHGTLFKYEVKEYLLEKFNHTCAYCGAKNVPLQVEHIVPKSRGGSNRVSNLTISCKRCNSELKKDLTPEQWLEKLKKKKGKQSKKLANNFEKAIEAAEKGFKDAAAVNTTRLRLAEEIKKLTTLVEFGTGALTKANRIQHRFPKEHYYDACCVGASTPEKLNIQTEYVQVWKAVGRGNRVLVNNNKIGFPISRYSQDKNKPVNSGDIVRGIQIKTGLTLIGRATSSGDSIYINKKKFSRKNTERLQRGDGWEYSKKKRKKENLYKE